MIRLIMLFVHDENSYYQTKILIDFKLIDNFMDCPKLLHLLLCNLKGQKETFAQEGTKTSIQLRTNGEDFHLNTCNSLLQRLQITCESTYPTHHDFQVSSSNTFCVLPIKMMPK